MELSRATLELLRDEAYLILSRETLNEALTNLENEKGRIVNSRPPFGVLAAKKTREAFENSLKTADHTEAALRERLVRVTRFETWLQRRIRKDLGTYLDWSCAEYQRVTQILRLLDEWEYVVKRSLPDTLVAFAREMRGLRMAAVEANQDEQHHAHELALLRQITIRVEEMQDNLARISNAVNAHALEIALVDVRVPPLPQFRRSAWVDWLGVVPLEQAVADITRVESEVRAFLHNGMQPVIGRLQASRVSCAQAHDNFLRQYWDQLRFHAQTHWIQERELDQVLETMSRRHDPDIARHQREVTHNPFLSDRSKR